MKHPFGYSVLLACFFAVAPAAHADTLLAEVTLVDFETGTPTEGQSVLIRDGTIAEVGPEIAPGDGSEVVDGAGGYLIPGLWDSHVHIFSSSNEPDTALPLYLLHGVTGIRDLGALWQIADQKALQARIEADEVLGPRLILSGARVDAAPGSWPGMFLADTSDEARAVVDRIAGEGWAAAKAYSMLNEPTYLALTEAAHDARLPLVGHIPERVALATAIAAGQDGMEHFGRVAMGCSAAEAQMIDDLRNAMAEERIALDRRTFLMAHDAGAPILASTDASFANPYQFHGFSLLDELDLHVEISLTPREGLFTATVAPPHFFGFSDQDGAIAPGRRADLVLLDANPLEDLATLRRPRAVIAGGQVLHRTDLDAIEAGLLATGE